MYRILLFDLDGTLTDPKEGITKSVSFALHHFGIDVPWEDLTCFIGPPLIAQFMEYAHFSHDEAVRALGYFRERFTDVGIFENHVIEGIPEMLRRLKDEGYTLCVASSKPEAFVERILERFDLRQYFTVVAGASLDETHTAKAEIIEDALARLPSPPDRTEVLMIGDRIHDIDGAAACSIDAIGCSFGYAPAGELETSRAKAVLASPCSIADWILRQK